MRIANGPKAALLGGVAAWLTYISTGEWFVKDYLFVVAVVAVVLLDGMRNSRIEKLIHKAKLKGAAHEIDKVEFIQGEPIQLELNKVTCILFFGTWCKKSREALQVLACLQEVFVDEASVQFVGLTQESREELAAYEVKGRNASNFRELKEFAFSIGIETGFMSKEYLVRRDLFTVPQLFIIGKDKSIAWYGDPCTEAVETKIRLALEQQHVQTTGDKESKVMAETAEEEAAKHSNAA